MSTVWIDQYLKEFGTATNDIRSLRYLADQLEAAVNEAEKLISDYGSEFDQLEREELYGECENYRSALSDVHRKLSAA